MLLVASWSRWFTESFEIFRIDIIYLPKGTLCTLCILVHFVSWFRSFADLTLTFAWVGVFLTSNGFVSIAQKPRRATCRFFLHRCLSIFSNYVKIFTPGHLRSGHQVSSSEPTSKKACDRFTVSDWEDVSKLSGFVLRYSTYLQYNNI